ncbi:MAG: PP2C family protein-serine/threonine phosphatase [Gammaproteobacteria bacterium]
MRLAISNKISKHTWSSYAQSDKGKVRKHNEDSVLARTDVGLWVVADGMGGHSAGDLASQMIINSLKEVQTAGNLKDSINDIEDRLLVVNKRLLEKALETDNKTTIGSTVVVMLAYSKYCIYMWAGDSRLYRVRNQQLRQMSKDHSQVELYVEKGLISREEALSHPHGNMITRAVGAADELFLDIDIQELASKDRYLLCSDGLTKHVTDLEIQDILGDGTSQESCKTLINLTLERGAVDNVTVIVVDID